MDKIQYRSFSGSAQASEEKPRVIEGYAVRFNEESQNLGFTEVIDRGAITQEVIDNSDIYCLSNHDPNKVLARSRYGEGSLQLELREDGLFYSFEAPETEIGRECLEHIKRGEMFTSSFAFVVSMEDGSEKWEKMDGVVKRTIYKIDRLFDVSPVFEAAYLTTSCDARSAEMMKRLAEEEEPKDPEEEPKDPENNEETNEVASNPVASHNNEDEGSTPKNEDEDPKSTSEDENRSSEDPTDDPDPDPTEDNDVDPEDPNEDNEPNKRNKNKVLNNMEFRLLKAINDIANNKQVDSVANAVFANGTEEMRKSGLSYGGQIQLPTSELRAAITVTTEGEDVVPTDLYDILEPLRAKNVLVQAGAKFLTGLVGDVQVPIMSAGNVTWEGETAPARDGAQTFTSVKLSPKRLTAFVDVSKQFLVQDSKSAEALIRQDIINAINSKLEETVLGAEAGTLTRPAGIFYLKEGTLDVVDSYAEIADFEAGIEDANVTGECVYIMSNKAKAAYRTMQKANGTGFVYENGTIDGTKVLNTSNVAGKNVAYGDFSNLAIGQWGAIDLTVDPYTKAADGQVRLVVNAYFDARVLRPEAIVVAKEA